jgi:SAM-dependent methyltransferase
MMVHAFSMDGAGSQRDSVSVAQPSPGRNPGIGATSRAELPFPPVHLRRLIGPTNDEHFDNPSRQPLFPDLPESAYSFVFDFGCGCGRLARQLIQQHQRPLRYRGIDPHKEMVDWCSANLAPRAPGFDFQHYDVFHEFMNPTGALEPIPLPAADDEVTLFLAWSVFTHLFEADARFYLRELARVLHPSGVAVTTWFLFDKADFPMMQEFQNALFISDFDPTNAVIFDRGWLSAEVSRAGLAMTRIAPPAIRGYQWTIHLQRQIEGRFQTEFPEDRAPRGLGRPPVG